MLLTRSTCTRPTASTPIQVAVLNGLDLEVQPGEFLSVVGASGSGKSTLLHLLGTLDRPDKGEHPPRRPNASTTAVREPRPAAQSDLRLHLPVLPPAAGTHDARKRADAADDRPVDLRLARPSPAAAQAGHRAARPRRPGPPPQAPAARTVRRRDAAGRHRPRARSTSRAVLLADEPTGNLDAETGGEIVRLLRDLNRQDGLTIIMVTHNMELVAATDRVVRLTPGARRRRCDGVSGHGTARQRCVPARVLTPDR